jgi:hypothetical protein
MGSGRFELLLLLTTAPDCDRCLFFFFLPLLLCCQPLVVDVAVEEGLFCGCFSPESEEPIVVDFPVGVGGAPADRGMVGRPFVKPFSFIEPPFIGGKIPFKEGFRACSDRRRCAVGDGVLVS